MSSKKMFKSHWKLKLISLLILALILDGALIYGALQTPVFTQQNFSQGNWQGKKTDQILNLGKDGQLKLHYGLVVDHTNYNHFNKDNIGEEWALPTTGFFQAGSALKRVNNFSGHIELPKDSKIQMKDSRVVIVSDNLLSRNYQSINKKINQDFNFDTQFTQFVNERSFFTMNFMAICVDFEKDGKAYRAILVQPGTEKEPVKTLILPIY